MMLSGREIRIVSLLILDAVFFLLEIIIGYTVHSLALIADSFHMLNDIFSLLVALWAVNVAKNREADAKYTYGWKRAEILGALINAVFLIALCVTILIEAIQRFFDPQEITNPKLILYVGSAGLMSNIIGLFLFHEHGHSHDHSHNHSHHSDNVKLGTNPQNSNVSQHSHHHGEDIQDIGDIGDILPATVVERYTTHNENIPLLIDNNNNPEIKTKAKSLNMHGVFLHVLGDALGNIGVMITALFIWKTDYTWRYYSDPLISLIITVIIFSSALPLSRKASRILLQGTPSEISADEVQKHILNVPGVISVHDFHIWNLTESFYIASIHVEIDSTPTNFMEVARLIRSIFHRYGIHSATVQPEFVSNDHISLDTYKKFSMIAGGVYGSSTVSLQNTSNNVDTSNINTVLTNPSSFAYGATSSETRCMVDEVSHCNADSCLTK